MIIVDYLITFRQLLDLQEKCSISEFHTSSEIEKIVEGNPIKCIKKEHVKGIIAKFKRIEDK